MKYSFKRYLDILFVLIKKELTLKYQNTILGYLWLIVNPLLLTFVYYFVFVIVFKIKTQNYFLYLIIGILVWNSITSSLMYGINSFISNASFVKKLPIPKTVIPLSVIIANQLPNFIILFSIGCIISSPLSLIWLVILEIIQLTLIVGIVLALSPINTIVRDLNNLINFFLNILFYLTPVVYNPNMIPAKYKFLLLINPFALLLTLWHSAILDGFVPSKELILLIGYDVITCVIGILLFKKLSDFIPEIL